MFEFFRTVILCFSVFVICACSLVPVRVSISAGATALPSNPEFCVVDIRNGENQFIQAIPIELSQHRVPTAILTYNPELQTLQVFFTCGWRNANRELAGGRILLPPNQGGHLRLAFSGSKSFWAAYSGVESVFLSFLVPLREDISHSSAERLIGRLLESGFKLDLNQSRLLGLDGDESLDFPVLGSVVRRSAMIRVRLGTADIEKSGFTIGCPDEVTSLPPETGTVTVPSGVAAPVSPESITWQSFNSESIDRLWVYKIRTWQFTGRLPRYRCG